MDFSFNCHHVQNQKPNLFLILTFFLFLSHKGRVKCFNQIENWRNCGRLDLVLTDIRSFAPWAVAIFRRVGGSSHNNKRWKFHTSGTIISPWLVVSTQAGPPGKFPSDKDPRNFLIVAGVNTTEFSKHDGFAQHSRVTFIQPLDTSEPHFKSFYHEVAYYLQKPLDFSTPYVKALCFPFFVKNAKNQFLKSWRIAQDAGVPLTTPAFGFASGTTRYGDLQKNGDRREWTLKVWKFEYLPTKVCASIFRFYYGHHLTPFCYKQSSRNPIIYTGIEVLKKARIPVEYTKNDDDLCFAPGSRIQGFVGGKWFSGTTAGFIPGRKWDRCGNKTVYFSAIGSSDPTVYAAFMEFFAKSERCGEGKFPCVSLNSSRCIPLNRTCDDFPDCEDESDEHPDICTWKTGQMSDRKKIGPIEKKLSFDLDPRFLAFKCPKFEFILDGVRCLNSKTREEIECMSSFYPGRRIRVECDRFYSASKYSFDHMDLFCNFDRKWVGYRPIYCQKDCGIFDDSLSTTQNFPWDVSIFENGTETCGGTLIQPTFVLTDERCLKKWVQAPKVRSTIQISVAGHVFLNKDKVEKFQIQNSWISSNSGPFRNKYENGIALIQLLKPVEQNLKILNLVMAACFLIPPFTKILSEQAAMMSNRKLLVSRENCNASQNPGFCTTSSLNPRKSSANQVETRPLEPVDAKIGAGLFLKRVEPSTGKLKHVLQGILSSVTKDGRGIFKNVDEYKDWIIDILEANS